MAVSVEFSWSQKIEEKLPERERLLPLIERAMLHALVSAGCRWGVVACRLVDDREIRKLNRRFRDRDEATDVLAFPQGGSSQPGELPGEIASDRLPEPPIGDVVISLETALHQAESYGHGPARELGFLAVHGTLHLLGYDHGTEAGKTQMDRLTERSLEAAGLERAREQ